MASKNVSTHKKVLVHGLIFFHVGKGKWYHVSSKGFICTWNISIWQTIGPLRYTQVYTCYNMGIVHVFGSAHMGLERHNWVDYVVVHLSRHLCNLRTIANRRLNICWISSIIHHNRIWMIQRVRNTYHKSIIVIKHTYIYEIYGKEYNLKLHNMLIW